MKIQESDGLIIVDVQNDFCPGGALPVLGGDAVVPVINRVMIHFSHLFFSQDWHPGDHCSFSDTPEYVDKSWPPHCVENTPGAEFHGDLRVPLDATFIRKGVNRDEEAYSAFHGTDLEKRLREKNIKRVFVAGLATDYCVRSTALDALKAGFETVIIEDACRGIADESVVEALQEITSQGATRCCSGDME